MKRSDNFFFDNFDQRKEEKKNNLKSTKKPYLFHLSGSHFFSSPRSVVMNALLYHFFRSNVKSSISDNVIIIAINQRRCISITVISVKNKEINHE